MDARNFDALARTVTERGTRRGLLALLAALPLVGGLLPFLDFHDSEAKGRRKRRKKAHKHGKGRHKNRKKKCKPKSKAQTCAGRCGAVKNTCKKMVDCGPCGCEPACLACFTCGETTRTCVADLDQQGDACGACATCDGSGQCVGCDAGLDCCGGECVDADSDPDNCGACSNACAESQVCQGGVCGVECGGDFCPAATEICDEGLCQTCDVCATCTHTTVQAAIDAANSGDTIRICAGAYTRSGMDRVATISNKDLTLSGAGAGSDGTIFDGEGVETGNEVLAAFQSVLLVQQLRVTGANGGSVIQISPTATMTLAAVTVTGNDSGGSTIFNRGDLTLNAGASVTGNAAFSGGGIWNVDGEATLTLHAGASVTGNTASNVGGGIFNTAGTVTLHAGSSVTGNTADNSGGGIFNVNGTVTLNPGSDVSGNFAPQGTPSNCVNSGTGTGCPA